MVPLLNTLMFLLFSLICLIIIGILKQSLQTFCSECHVESRWFSKPMTSNIAAGSANEQHYDANGAVGTIQSARMIQTCNDVSLMIPALSDVFYGIVVLMI